MSTASGALARNTSETELSERTIARREKAGSQFFRPVSYTHLTAADDQSTV